jgi:hypothetical protein
LLMQANAEKAKAEARLMNAQAAMLEKDTQ